VIGGINYLPEIDIRFAIAVVLVALALFSSFLSSITNAVNALRSVRLSSASQEEGYGGIPRGPVGPG